MKTPAFGLVLVAAFAIGTGLNGLYSGVTSLPSAPNALATVVGVLNLLMGVSGIATTVLTWRQDRRAMIPMVMWGACVIGAALLAPRAYAPQVGWPPAITAAIMTGALVITTVLYARWRLSLTAPGGSPPPS